MGFYPKHLKVRRQRWNERTIATAGISGAVFQQVIVTEWGDYMDRIPPSGYGWQIIYADGKESRAYTSKGEAAATYLLWWFGKNDVFPKRRIA